ncbi:MAG: STAS domain-containing protein [Acidimicrobiales bacterium]
MPTAGSSFFTVSDRLPRGWGGPESAPIVVWLWGEQDLSTDDALRATLASAIALDSAGLVLDLSEVEFMAASTVGVIVRARELLRQRSASLAVRAPSAPARRSIDACGPTDLLGPSAEMAGTLTGTALCSLVAVPALERGDGRPAPSAPMPERPPARVGPTLDLSAQAASAVLLAE